MEKLFIKAKANVSILKILQNMKMEEKIGLVSTAQFIDEVEKSKWNNFVFGGMVLGCDISNALKIKDKVDSYLFIGDGEFHAKEIAFKTGKKVYIGNPFTGEFKTIYPEEFYQKEAKRIEGSYLKYLNAKKVGFLVSVKVGQANLEEAQEFDIGDKKKYIFLFDTLDFNQLENFPDVDVWVNTACPRIASEDYEKFNKPVINLRDLKEKL